MEPLSHSCHNDKDNGTKDVWCPSPPVQISVSSTLPASNESVIPSWLQRMKDEEEELEEAMVAALASGTAYYLDSSDNDDDFNMTVAPQAPSVNSTTSFISAPPSFDPDVAFDPDPTVRIIKPLPKRNLKSRFPDAVRVIKPLPKRTLRSRITIPLSCQMSEARNFSGPETQLPDVEGSATSSSPTYILPSPPSSDHDRGDSENLTVTDAVRVVKPLPKRMSKDRSFHNPKSEPPVAEGSTTPSLPAYIPPSPPPSLISDHDIGGSEDLTIPDTVRVIKALPKRMSKGRSFNDPGTHPPAIEVSTTPSPPTYMLSNSTPDHDIGGSENQTRTTTTQFCDSPDRNAGLSMQTMAVTQGLTTSLALPSLPAPIRPIDNGIESFFATTPPHNYKALSDPMAGPSTSMNSLSVPITPASLAKPTSSMPSKSLPVSFNTENRSRAKLPQTLADVTGDDDDLSALIRRFSKSSAIWVDDDPDPIPPTVLQMSRRRQMWCTDSNGVATPIPPTRDRAAANSIVDLTETNTRHSIHHSEEVREYDINMPSTSQIFDSNVNNTTLTNSFQNTGNSSNHNSFAIDDPNSFVPEHKTNDVQSSDTITSTFESNIFPNEPSSFSESPASLSRSDSIPNQLDGDASMGVGDHQPSWQQGFDNDDISSVEQYDSNPTYHLADSPKLTSINVDNQQSPIQVSAFSEVDDCTMNDESDMGLPTSIVSPGLKDGLLVAKKSTADPVEEPTAYGTLFEKADPWDTVGHILGLSNTRPSKTLGEVEERNEIGTEDTTAAPMLGNMSLAKFRTPKFSPNLLPNSNNENIFMNDFGTHLHHESSSPQARSLSLELDNNESELSVAHNIPIGQSNDVPILQTPLHPDDPSQTPGDPGTNYMSEDSSGDESLEEVQIGDDIAKDTHIHKPVVAIGFTAGRSVSTEGSSSNSELASITVNDPTSSIVRLQSTSVSHSELSHSVLGHYPNPNLSPEEQEQFISASDPIPSESAPASGIDPLSRRGQTNSSYSDTASVDDSSSSREPTQSVSVTSSVPVITITRCEGRTQSPPIHTSPTFLSSFFRPRSLTSPSILQPAVPDNSDVPSPAAPADIRAPYIEVFTTIETQPLDAVTPTAVTVSQPSTTHVPSTLYQDIPIFPDHVTFDTRNLSFVPPAPAAEVYAPFLYETSDVDMCPDTSSDPSYLPHDYQPIANNTSSSVPEMWSWGDTQQGPNEDDDRMDLPLDEQMTFSSASDLHEQSHQVDSEIAFAGDWCCAEGDVEMGGAMLPEPEAAHEVTLMDIDPSTPAVATTLEASVDAPLPITQTPSLSASISLLPRSTVSMTIPPLHPQLLTGDMNAFIQQISTVVKTLDSLTSLKLETQPAVAIQLTATQLASAANNQPMAHERVLQTPDSEAPAHESTTGLSSDTPDNDEFSSIDGNSVENETTQSEDIDSKIHPNHLSDYAAESNMPSGSNPKRGLRTYDRWSMVNDASWSKFPHNSGEMQSTDQDGPPFEGDFTRIARISSKTGSKSLNLRSSIGSSPWRGRFRVRVEVDIVNTRFNFGTETSGLQSQSSAQSTALRMEVSSQMKSIPELSTSATPQLDKVVEAPSFWGRLWGALTLLF